MSADLWWNHTDRGKPKYLETNFSHCPLCPTEIPLGMTWDRTRASSLRDLHNIAWVMAWPTAIQTEPIVFKVKNGPWNFCLSAMSAKKQTENIAQLIGFQGSKCWKILFAKGILQQILLKNFSAWSSLYLCCR